MNVSTLWRELEKRMSEDIALDGVDPLHVIEWAMRYFFGWRRPGVKLSVKVSEKSIERHDGVDCQNADRLDRKLRGWRSRPQPH
jgi:hypothetical protein